MKNYQYSFQATCNGIEYTIRCTAPNVEYAYVQAKLAYRGFDVSKENYAVHDAHKVYGEIDAAGMTEEDYQYCLRQLEK